MHVRQRPSVTALLAFGVAVLAGGGWPGITAPGQHAPCGAQTQAAAFARAYVLDWAARSVTTLDAGGNKLCVAGYGPESIPRRGPFSGSFPITFNVFQKEDDGTPAEMILSPNVARLAVIDHGPGKDTTRFGWHSSRRSTVAVFGSQTLRPLAALDGVWGLPALHRVSPSGRTLTLVGPGYRSDNPGERRPPELVNIDLRAGTVVRRFDLSDTVLPASNRDEWIDTTALSPDGQFLYVLDRGRGSGADSGRDPQIVVVATATGVRVRSLAAGSNPRGLVVDEESGYLLVLSDRPSRGDKERIGELTMVRGDEVAAAIAVAPEPLFLRVSPDRGFIHVFSAEALTTVDARAMRQSGSVAIKRAGISWSALGPVQGTREVEDAIIAPDGRSAYVVHHGSSRLSIVDLEAQKVTATVTTGRPSAKVRLELTALAASALSQWTAERQARALGYHRYYYTTYFVLPARTSLVTGPDGRHVYVVNSQTRDVTVVESATTRVVGHIAVRGPYLQVLPDSHLLAVGHPADLSFIDTRTNTLLEGVRMRGEHHVVTASPDGSQVFVLSRGQVTALDPRSGKPMVKSTEFLVPFQMAFANSPTSAADEGIDDAAPNPFDLKTADGVLPASRWQVLHLHRASKCGGWLYTSATRIGFRNDADDGHSWESAFADIKEVKTNKAFGGGAGLGSFHVTLLNGDNYNFSLNGISSERLVSQLAAMVATHKAPR